nr:non-structural [Opsiphanes invirae iflavirus 1]
PVCSKISDFFSKGLTNTFSSIAGLSSDLKNLISQPKHLASTFEDAKIKGLTMLEQIKQVLHLYTNGIDTLQITSLALTLISVFKDSSNIYSLLSALCQILSITGVFHVEAVANAMSKFSLLFSNNDENKEEAKHQMDNQSWSTVAAIFSSILLETFFAYRSVNQSKFNVDESYVKQVMIQTFKNFNVMRSGALCILMSRVCKALEFLYTNARKWIRGLEKYDILADDPKFIQNFMIDYEFFMDERNLSSQSMIQRHRDRFWTTVLTAYYLKSVLATVDKKYINTTLQAAVREVILKANSLKSHMSAPPVRYEPFCVWYYGEPGTGKTTMMQNHLIDMTKNINCTYNADPIYVRSPHSQWWNGYDNQPIVMIDDANGVNDPTILGRMVSEFQAMKTSAKMRLEMPRLEEKNAEMTSIVLGICSNVKEWTSTMIVDQQAFRRRRDIVVEVIYSSKAKEFFNKQPNLMKAVSSLPKALVDANEHVKFKVLHNPSSGQENGIEMEYEEFCKHLLSIHEKYHTQEIEKMFARYQKSLTLSKTLAGDIMDQSSLKTALLAVILGCESTEVMAETMKRQLYELKQVTPERFNALPKHTQSLLNKMSTLPVHQAPAVANSADLHQNYNNSSHWFKNEFMPNFQIGNFYQRIKQRYAPWSYNDIMTVDTDMITSPCAVCNSLPSNQNHLYKMCGNSVEENQHWICTECAQGFDLQNSINCPVCREEKLVQFNNDQRHWRWYAKLQHIAHEVVKDFKTPLVMTTKILWENARTIMLTSLIFGLLARSLVLTYQMIKEIQLESIAEQQVQRFVGVFGVLPNSVRYIGDTIYLTAGQNTFVERNENGVYSYSIVNDSVYYEMGKKSKSEPRPTISSIPDVKYYSAASSDEEEKMPSIPLKFEPLNIDVMKLLPPVQCTEVHGETSLDVLRNPNLKYNVGYSDKKFIVNIRETGKEVTTLELPYTRCVEANCKFNGIMNKVAQKYYLARYKIWQDAMLEGEDISDIEDEVPQEMVHAVEEMVDRPLETPKPLYLRFIDYQKSLLLALKGILMSWYQTIYDAICNKWKYILGILTLAFATYFGIKYYYSDEDGITLEPEHQGSGEHKTGRNHSKLNTARTRTLVRAKRTQHEMKISLSTQVPINIQNIRDLIFKNRFVMSCCGTNVYSFAIMNNYGLLPRHAFYYFAKLQEMGQPIVFQQGDVKEIIKDRITLYCVEDNVLGEYVIFQFKRLIGKDIRHHFYSTIHEEITYPSYAYGIDLKDQVARPVQVVDVKQYDLDKNPLEHAPTVSTTWTTNVEGKEEDFKYESKLTTYLIISNFYGDGKCGSPIVNSEGKIIGIHFAGQYIAGNSYGYSYPVFTDDFMGLTVMGTTQENKVEHQMESFPNLEFYSHYPNAPFHTDTSRIHPSAIAERAWESVTEPCIQSNSDPRYVHGNSPLYDGATTIGAVTNPPIPDILNEAIHAVSQELIQNMPTPAMKVPVSQEEAVNAANHQFVRAMNLASSAGLPLIVDNPGKNLKSDYIENKINSDGTSTVTFTPEFQKLYDINWSMRLAGTVPEDPYWAHLKDERRKPEKARSFGGTRVFSVSPLELVVSSRRVLLPMMDAFHSDPIRLHHAIGLSTESIAWSEMIETLRAKSHLIIQLDFSKFSDSMPWEFVQGAFQVISNYYETYGLLTPEIENLLKTLEHNITRSLICIGRYIYRVKNGVLQGHPLTSLINSIVNLIEQTYVWIKITGLTGSEFFRYCGIVVMGDDVVISVPRQILKRYNGKTIANAFLEMNIVVTDENKNKEEIIPYQNINRFDFLSCSYKLHPYRYLYLAPADISSIFDTALWISRKDGPFFDATLENAEQSLNNSFGHGPCIYEIYRAVLQFLTGSRFRSWFELDMIFYGSKGLPERSIIATNLGIVTGTSPKVLELLGAGTGRIERASKSERDSQYWNADFLSVALLDTQGIVTGKYRCDCRFPFGSIVRHARNCYWEIPM